MVAVAELADPFARCGLLVLRGAGLRLGERLDLELDSVVDYGPARSWLRVPLGKLGTERSVPLDPDTLAALDAWTWPCVPPASAATRAEWTALGRPRATRPNEVWSWDISRLLGPVRWTWFYLSVIADIYRRSVPGWPLARGEQAQLAEWLADSIPSRPLTTTS
jgi:transposase InsO family protein